MTSKTGSAATLFVLFSVSLVADAQRIRGKDMLNFHNYLRCLHGTQPLQWDNGLAASAQEWAYNRQNAGCVMTHSGYAKLGENVAAGTWRGLTGYNYWASDLDVINAWYHEPFTYGSSSITINHFTQVVWQGTTRVGCAWAPCNSSENEFWVCQYTPAGNMMTAASINTNVPKPCRTQAQCQFLLNGMDLNGKFGTAAKATTALVANQINPSTWNYGAQTCLTPIANYKQPTNPFCLTDSSTLPKNIDTVVQNPTSTGALSVVMNCPSGQAAITCTSASTWNIGTCGVVTNPPVINPPPPPATTTTTQAPGPAPTTPAPSSGCWGTQVNGFLSGFAPGWTYKAGLTQAQAKSACLLYSGCNGITKTAGGWEPRAGNTVFASKTAEVSILRLSCSPTAPAASGKCWGPLLVDRYLYLYPNGYTPPASSTLAQAKAACASYSDCGGVTYTGTRWEARAGKSPMVSTRSEQSYLVVPCAAQAETSSLPSYAPWLIPVVAAIGILLIAIIVVLFRKTKRDRRYSGSSLEKSEPEVTNYMVPESQQTEQNITERPILESQPTYSQVPNSPTSGVGVESPRLESSNLLSPSSAEPTEKQGLFPQETPLPTQPSEKSVEIPSTSEWSKMTDLSTGQPYYYNNKSGVTQWEVPDNI